MSQVTVGTQTTVANLYISILGRNPEPAGFGFWVDRLADNGNTPAAAADIARGFANSPEFIGTYGAQTTTGAMTLMYNNVLNRAPDAGGLAFWVGQANALIARGQSVGDAYALTGAAIITTAGTNSSSDTALIVAKQTAAIASGTGSGGSGQTFTLTTNIETINANNGTVEGVVNAGAGTFQTGDTINNASNINVTVAAASTDASGLGPLVAVNKAGAITFTTLAAAPVNAQLFSQVGTVGSKGSTNILTVNNAALTSVYALSNTVSGSSDGLTVAVRNADVTGTANTINFSVSGVGTAGIVASNTPAVDSALVSTNSGVESIRVATAGTNFFSIRGSTGEATASNSLLITGNGTNSIDARGMTQATSYDMSASTGTNTLRVSDTLASSSTILGGTGADTLRIAPTSGLTIANLTVTNVETLRLNAGSTGGSLSFAAAPNFTTVRVDGDGSESDANYTLNTVGSFSNLRFAADGISADANQAKQFMGLTVNNSFAGAGSSVSVAFDNQGTTILGTNGYTVRGNGILANGVEAFNVSLSNLNSASRSTINLDSNTLQTASFSGLGRLTSTVDAAPTTGNSALTSVDLSGMTTTTEVSTLTLTNGSVGSNTEVKASVGGTTLNIQGAESSNDSLVFIGNNGNDTINAGTFAGSIVASLGDGTNQLNTGSSAASVAVTAATNGSANTVTVTTAGTVSYLATGAGSSNTIDASTAQAAVTAATQRNTVTYTAAVATGATFGVTIDGTPVTWAAATNTITSAASGAAAAISAAGLGVTATAADGVVTITSAAAGDGFTLTAQPAGTVASVTANRVAVDGTAVSITAAGSTQSVDIIGSANNDILTGGSGNDSFNGGAGFDRITVGAGIDTVILAALTDTLSSGTVFSSPVTVSQTSGDIVYGLGNGDRINLALLDISASTVGTAFTADLATDALALIRGTWNGSTFTSGTAAADNDYFLQIVETTGTDTNAGIVLVDIIGTVTATVASEIITLSVA